MSVFNTHTLNRFLPSEPGDKKRRRSDPAPEGANQTIERLRRERDYFRNHYNRVRQERDRIQQNIRQQDSFIDDYKRERDELTRTIAIGTLENRELTQTIANGRRETRELTRSIAIGTRENRELTRTIARGRRNFDKLQQKLSYKEIDIDQLKHYQKLQIRKLTNLAKEYYEDQIKVLQDQITKSGGNVPQHRLFEQPDTQGGLQKNNTIKPNETDDNGDIITTGQLMKLINDISTIVSKGKKQMSHKQFVEMVYYPYSQQAFGIVYLQTLSEEIINACEEDEMTETIQCTLSPKEIESYLLKHKLFELQHIKELFGNYKHSSYVLQRLWDMGYHQAKDVVKGFEETQASSFKPEHALTKTRIFGFENDDLPANTCFVSGASQMGVGDHIYPVRAIRHITGCYGGNSQWNLVPVKSDLNQPYKTCILYLSDQTLIKTSLDYTTLEPIDDFPNLSYLTDNVHKKEKFTRRYNRVKKRFENQPFKAVIRKKGWYLEDNKSQKEIVHNGCILVRNIEHLWHLMNISKDDLDKFDTFPKLTTWMPDRDNNPKQFIINCLEKKWILDSIASSLGIEQGQVRDFLNIFIKKTPRSDDEQNRFVEYTKNVPWPLKKSHTLKECLNFILELTGFKEIASKLTISNAIPIKTWLENKEAKGMYEKADAYDIWFKLCLWEHYVSTITTPCGSPKMFWEMTVSDFDVVEESLRMGVKSIDKATQDFLKNKRCGRK